MSRNIIFFGTPAFAVHCLKKIVTENFKVIAVVTAPDRPSGRGRQLHKSAVKEFSEQHKLPLLQPTNLKDPLFIDALKTYAPDLMIVVAFRMLPKEVWSIPPQGTFNLHASLLPITGVLLPLIGQSSIWKDKQVLLHFLSMRK